MSCSALAPRTQRSVTPTVPCGAGAHLAALRRIAFWAPALRSNAYASQRVRGTGADGILADG